MFNSRWLGISRNWTLAFVGMIAVVIGGHQSWAEADDTREGIKILGEGDALADKGDTTGAVIRYKAAFEKILPKLRGLPFKREVGRDVTPREKLKDVILQEIDESSTPEEFRGNELALKAFGLIPMSLNLKETLVKLYTEEIAAFYDTHTEKMHLIKEPEKKTPPSLLERLLGRTGGFDKEENKTVIAHEMTHALADQNFDLDKLDDAAKGDDDRVLALQALIEGEATLAMMGASMEDWDGKETVNLPGEAMGRSFAMIAPFLSMTGGPQLRQAPQYLMESLTFPYLQGLVFTASLTNKGGWEALNQAYRNPPLSTEQILHPEKYLTNPDAPTKLDPGPLPLAPEWKEVHRNVMGEMAIGVLLRRQGGKSAAVGWDGDTYIVFENSQGKLGLAWITTWDSEADATKFTNALERYQVLKLQRTDTNPKDPPAQEVHQEKTDPTTFVQRRGQDVALLQGFPKSLTESLMKTLFASSKIEKTHAPASTPKEPRTKP